MAKIEDVGEQEFYAPFVRIEGKRATLLVFYEEDEGPPMQLAAELADVLDMERAS